MQPTVPRRERQVVAGQEQRGREMERVAASQLARDRELGGVLRERRIDFDDAEGRPLGAYGPGSMCVS
ncbi:MAG: hypothetical protein JWQ48_1268 [Conexibacter sp.]|nr:hypothetical protein [Conexibacter sp.]